MNQKTIKFICHIINFNKMGAGVLGRNAKNTALWKLLLIIDRKGYIINVYNYKEAFLCLKRYWQLYCHLS